MRGEHDVRPSLRCSRVDVGRKQLGHVVVGAQPVPTQQVGEGGDHVVLGVGLVADHQTRGVGGDERSSVLPTVDAVRMHRPLDLSPFGRRQLFEHVVFDAASPSGSNPVVLPRVVDYQLRVRAHTTAASFRSASQFS